MADLILPPLSPLAKAARGWPSSPNAQPQINLAVDWPASICSGLVFAATAAQSMVDHVTGEAPAGSLNIAAYKKEGRAHDVNASSANVLTYQNTKRLGSLSEFTFFAVANSTWQEAAAVSDFAGNSEDNVDGFRIFAPLTNPASSGYIRFRIADQSLNANITAAPASNNEPLFIIGRFKASTTNGLEVISFSPNANYELSASATTGATACDFTKYPLKIGLAGGGSEYSDSQFYAFYLWNRSISDAEVSLLKKNNYAVFKPANSAPYLVGLPSAAAVNEFYLPGDSALAKAARGWPTSPNVKPNIPVEINWSNPITKNLVAYCQADGMYDLVSGNAYTVNDLEPAVCVNGKGIELKVDAGESYTPTTQIPAKFTGDYTIFGTVFVRSWPTADQNYIAAIDAKYGIAQRQNANAFYAFGGTAIVGNSHAGDVNRLYTVCTMRRSGTAYLFVDGVQENSGSAGSSVSADEEFCVGAWSITGQFNNPDEMIILQAGCLDRAWTDAEARQHARNPFSLEKPANSSPYLVGVAGGATAYTLTADKGTFTLTGNATGLEAGRDLTATLQTYALTGNATGLLADRDLAAAVQSYTLTGFATGFDIDRNLIADLQTYSLTGYDASLDYSASAAPTLSAPVVTAVNRTSATVGCTVTF